MRFSVFLVWVMLVISMSAHAFEPKIEIVEQYDDLRMVAFISAQDIDDSPVWYPDQSPPPLSLGDAISIVRSLNKTGAIKEIEIREVPKHENKWHYLVKIADDAKTTRYDIYVVLMNGKVIPAIIEPQGYK